MARFLALAVLLPATFREVFFPVLGFRVAFLARLGRVFFLAAIGVHSLFDAVTGGESSLADRSGRRVTIRPGNRRPQ